MVVVTLATWCVRKLRGDAALCAVPRVVGGGVELYMWYNHQTTSVVRGDIRAIFTPTTKIHSHSPPTRKIGNAALKV
jgi:hypothetical protein